MLSDDLRMRLSAARQRLAVISNTAMSVSEIAHEALLSTSHFIRRFAAVFGDSPHQFRIRARLEWARRQLALTDRSVTDISFGAGFSSLGSFSSQFSKRTGMCPTAYRRRARGLATEDIAASMEPGCIDLMNRAFAQSPLPADSNFEEADTSELR